MSDEDNFQVILDTFMDRRTGHMFAPNPLGAGSTNRPWKKAKARVVEPRQTSIANGKGCGTSSRGEPRMDG